MPRLAINASESSNNNSQGPMRSLDADVGLPGKPDNTSGVRFLLTEGQSVEFKIFTDPEDMGESWTYDGPGVFDEALSGRDQVFIVARTGGKYRWVQMR